MSPDGRRELGELLRQLLTKQSDLPAGALQIIGLEAIRTRLGESYAPLHARIMRACRRIIEAHVVQPDLSIELPDEDSWLLIFVDASHGDPETICRHIREEIARYCMGEIEAQGIRIELPLTTLAELCAEGSVMAEMIQEATVASSGSRAPAGPVRSAPALRKPQRSEKPPMAGGGAEAAAPLLSEPQARAAADHLPSRVKTTKAGEIIHRFRPVWDASAHRLISNLCVGTAHAPDGSLVDDLDALSSPDNWEEIGWLDRTCLIQGVTALNDYQDTQDPIKVTVQAHYDAVVSYGLRARYTALLGEVPRYMRKHLYIEITGIPSGAPPQNLAQLNAAFKPFCQQIYASQAIHSFNPAVYVGAGFKIVGLSMRHCRLSVEQLGSELWRMGTALKRMGMQAYLRDVHSPQIAAIAAQNGFRFVSGEALFGDLEVPLPQQPLPPDFLASTQAALAQTA